MRKLKGFFSKDEMVLWSSSVMVIIVSFCVFDRTNYMTLCASIIGVTSLIFNAKGNPIGQLLFMFEMETAFAGAMLNIDTFNQPGVEGGKNATYALFGRKGYEGTKKEMDSAPAKNSEYTC